MDPAALITRKLPCRSAAINWNDNLSRGVDLGGGGEPIQLHLQYFPEAVAHLVILSNIKKRHNIFDWLDSEVKTRIPGRQR